MMMSFYKYGKNSFDRIGSGICGSILSIIFVFFIIAIQGCSKNVKPVEAVNLLSADEHIKLGIAYEAKGDMDSAVEEYKKALLREPDNPRAHLFFGNVLMKKKDFEGAEREYKEVIYLNPSLCAAYNNLAWLYIKRHEKFSEAERLLKKAVALDVENSPAYYDTLGVLYYEKGDYTLSEQTLLKALNDAKGETREKVLSHLVQTYNKMGLGDNVKKMLQEKGGNN